MCAQIVGSIQNTNKIFHGLVDWYIVPRQILPTLEAVVPQTTWTVGGVESQDVSSYLAGAGVADEAILDVTLTGTFTIGATIGVALHQIDTGADDADVVFIEADLQSADALADAIADLQTNFAIARAGVGTCTNGRIYSKESASIAAIGTGVTAKYAAVTGATIHFILHSAADNTGNDYDVTFYVLAAPPTAITLNSEGQPTIAGAMQGAYFNGGVELNFAGTQQLIESTQSFEAIDDYISGSLSTITIAGLLQDRSNWRALEIASGISGKASNDSYDIVLPNLLRTQKQFGLVFIVDSQDVQGQKDIIVIYRVAGLGYTRKFDKIHSPISVVLTPKAVGTRPDKLAIFQYRPVAA